MYAVEKDAYCYPGTTVLKNLAGITNQADLTEFEAGMSATRSDEPLPPGELDARHYLAIHHHLFQDVYEWAGKIRNVRIGKGGNWFCFPDYIDAHLKNVFDKLAGEDYLRGLDKTEFAGKLAHFLAELNAVHAFREGNGRAQLALGVLLADEAGHPLDLDQMDPEAFLEAMIDSFGADEAQLAAMIRAMV